MTESYFSRWAISATLPRSLAATISTSAPDCFTARKKLRPIRPKPLTPTRMVIGEVPPEVAVDVELGPIRSDPAGRRQLAQRRTVATDDHGEWPSRPLQRSTSRW